MNSMQEENYSFYLDQANELLSSASSNLDDLDDKYQKSTKLAELIILLANEKQTLAEKKRVNNFLKILNTLQGRAIVSNLIDQSFRSKSLNKTLDQISHIITLYGFPLSFPKPLKFKFFALKFLKSAFPKYLKNFMQSAIIKESLNVLNFADNYNLKKYFNETKKMNQLFL